MSPRHIHLVIPGPLDQRTGGYRYDARMVEGLRAHGWQVDVHALEGTFPSGADGGKHALAGALGALPDGAVVVIDGLASGGNPEPLEENSERLCLLSVVHHPLADETGLSPSQRAWLIERETRALAACLGVIVTSDSTAQRLADFGVTDARTRTVRPGTQRAAPARGPGPGEPARLLCVGTVTPRKGYDVLIEALARVRDLPWTCVSVGSLTRDPVHAATISQLCVDKGLTDRVTFTGECDEDRLEAFFDNSSLFVSASHYEGYGMAFAEALMRGLPIVGTTGGAIDSTVPDDAGILVRPGDVEALAGALRRVLEDPALRLGMATAAARHAADLRSWDQAAHEFAYAIQQLAPSVSDAIATVDR